MIPLLSYDPKYNGGCYPLATRRCSGRSLPAFIRIDVSTRPVTIRVQHMLFSFLLVASYGSRRIDDSPMHLVRADPLNASHRVA
jgi:hypothetical protein